MERMTPGDAAFLHLEDDVSAMHNATLAVFAGPAPTFAELRERVAGRVALVPRLRQRVAEVPLGLSRPVWADDPHFSVDYHVRHTAIPAEGGEEALSALMGRLLGQRLDRGKPLWELWMVRGLDHDRWALISKVHHAALDGVSGTDPLVVVFDQLRRAPKDHQPGITTDMPSRADLLARAAADVLTSPVEQLRLGRRGLDRVGRAVRRLSSATRPPARPTVFTDPGPHRRWRRLRVPLDPLRTRRDELGASTHAVVLALVTSGFRTALTERVIPAPAELNAVVPIAAGAAGAAVVSAVPMELPLAETDPRERVRVIQQLISEDPAHEAAMSGARLGAARGFSAPAMYAEGVRVATRFGHRLDRRADTVIVNVPGPRNDLSLLGAPLVDVFPVIPLAGRVGIAVGVLSYHDDLAFGITADWELDDELDGVCRGIEEAAAALGADPGSR